MSKEHSANERCGFVNAVSPNRVGLRLARLDLAPQIRNKLLTGGLAADEKGSNRNRWVGLLRPALPVFCNTFNALSGNAASG